MDELTGVALEKFIAYKLKKHDTTRLVEGENYYKGKHDIDRKKRIGLNDQGQTVALKGLPNIITKDNQYAKLVDQKVNYSFFNPPIVVCKEDETYAKSLQEFFNMQFMRLWRKIARDAMNMKIGWLYVYTDKAKLYAKRIDPKSIIPIWTDDNHDSLKALIRKRTEGVWDTEKAEMVTRQYVDYYTENGVISYLQEDDKLKRLSKAPYMVDGQGNGYNWGKIPFVYFKYSDEEITLLERVKSLQDIINLILSTFGDRMMEDSRNSILVIRGYDGESPEDIRYEMNQTGILQIDQEGDVDTLSMVINADNYETYLTILKERLIENGRGFDLKQDKSGHAPNELNIKGMYTEIDLDANMIELEFQASFEYLQYFFKKVHGIKDEVLASLEFKRRIMVNDESTVKMIKDSAGLVSERTLREKHPFIDDIDEEEARIKEERQDLEGYQDEGF